MKWNKTVIFTTLLILGHNAYAGQIDGDAVLGSVIGAAAGSAIGSASGGRDGAIIGGGIGGAVGAAIGSKNDPVRSSTRVVSPGAVYVNGYHDNGRHNGYYKHQHRHQHGQY